MTNEKRNHLIAAYLEERAKYEKLGWDANAAQVEEQLRLLGWEGDVMRAEPVADPVLRAEPEVVPVHEARPKRARR